MRLANTHRILRADAKGVAFKLKPHAASGLSCLMLSADADAEVEWALICE